MEDRGRKKRQSNDDDDEYVDEPLRVFGPKNKKALVSKKVNLPPVPKAPDSRIVGDWRIFQIQLDEWKRKFLNNMKHVSLKEFSLKSLNDILTVFGKARNGNRSVLEWRVEEIRNGRPVLNAIKVWPLANWTPPNQMRFDDFDNQHGMFMTVDLFTHLIIQRVEIFTRIKIMMTCKRFYTQLASELHALAVKTFGSFGTIICFSLEEHLKWLKKTNLVAASRIRDRICFSSDDAKTLSVANILWHKSGFIHHLNDPSALFEQDRLKYLDRYHVEQMTTRAINAFNMQLTQRNLEYLHLDQKEGRVYVMESAVSRASYGMCRDLVAHFESEKPLDDWLYFFNKDFQHWIFPLYKWKSHAYFTSPTLFSALRRTAKLCKGLVDKILSSSDPVQVIENRKNITEMNSFCIISISKATLVVEPIRVTCLHLKSVVYQKQFGKYAIVE